MVHIADSSTHTLSTCNWTYINLSAYINRNAPSSDPLLSLRFYERTYEQQAALGFLAEPTKESGDSSQDASTVEGNSGGPQRIPHGSVGAVAGRRAIAQGNSDEITAALCRYSAPEEVHLFSRLIIISTIKISYGLQNLLGQVDTLPSTCAACATECVTRFFSTSILSTLNSISEID